MSNTRIQDIYPLSPMQGGLLFQALYAPNSDAYFVQDIFELNGKIDAQALQSAWQMVSDHHPILRTGIIWEKLETPLQYVLESVAVPFIQYDWQNLNEETQQEKLEELIQKDRKQGFDLSKAPLFRLILIRHSKDRYCLIWSQHHILLDGWGSPIILADVFNSYEEIKAGRAPSLPARRPYRDYIAWLQQQDITKAEAFWKDYLAHMEGPTLLSFKDIINKNPEKDYDTYSLQLSVEETEQLRKFAQEHNLTLNTVIQGAVGLVLKTYTQQPEVIMGVTVSGRTMNLPGVEEMVGLFINTLPLRIVPQPRENITSFFKRLQEQAQTLNDYCYTPLAQIQSWTGINQSLFNVIFVFENFPTGEEAASIQSDLEVRGGKGIEKTEYPLTIAIGPGKRLYISLSFQTEHFNEEIIKKLSNHIKQILHHIIDPQSSAFDLPIISQSIHTLSLLTSQEKHQLLFEWNETKAEYP
ncbi:MAG: condensation domain-containing protein, partial [Alphaproteobacteria bacterium]